METFVNFSIPFLMIKRVPLLLS